MEQWFYRGIRRFHKSLDTAQKSVCVCVCITYVNVFQDEVLAPRFHYFSEGSMTMLGLQGMVQITVLQTVFCCGWDSKVL